MRIIIETETNHTKHPDWEFKWYLADYLNVIIIFIWSILQAFVDPMFRYLLFVMIGTTFFNLFGAPALVKTQVILNGIVGVIWMLNLIPTSQSVFGYSAAGIIGLGSGILLMIFIDLLNPKNKGITAVLIAALIISGSYFCSTSPGSFLYLFIFAMSLSSAIGTGLGFIFLNHQKSMYSLITSKGEKNE